MKKTIYVLLGVMILGVCGFAAVFVLNFGNLIVLQEMQLNVSGLDNVPLTDRSFAQGGNVPPLHHHSAPYSAVPEVTPVITPITQIIYEYYDEERGFFSTTQPPADMLLGKTAEEIAAFFADWYVLRFDGDIVHLRQSTDIQRRNYIIGVVDGYIAVFYDNGSFVKELTNRPVAALAEEEQQRLMEGIEVRGNDELMRALEDFSS